MENFYFNKPTRFVIGFNLALWLSIVLIAIIISASGCKSRKVEKDYSKSVDKTETGSVVSKKEIAKDSTKINTNKVIIKETKETDSTVTETTTETEFYEPNGVIPPNSKKSEKKHEKTNAKAEKNELSKEDIAMQLNNGNIQESRSDSTGFTNNDNKEIVKTKKVDAKMNWVNIGVGAGIFILILFAGIIGYKKFKK